MSTSSPSPAGGTGKTLMALAAGSDPVVLDDRRYTEIIVTRATVSVGGDIGFPPGTEEEKWALDGRAGRQPGGAGQKRTPARRVGRAAANELIRSRIKIKSMNFMRGRTVHEQVRHHRRGAKPDAQADEDLDHPRRPRHQDHLHGQSGPDRHPLPDRGVGLTYAVDRFKGWPHGGHITLVIAANAHAWPGT